MTAPASGLVGLWRTRFRRSAQRSLLRIRPALVLLLLSGAGRAEYTAEPNDTLLLNPARAIEAHADSVIFRASRYTYVLQLPSEEWRVRPEDNGSRLRQGVRGPYAYRGPEGAWCFDGMSDGNKGILRGWRGSDTLSTPLLRRTLWDRQRLAAVWGFDPDYPTVDEPIVCGVTALDGYLWIAIGFYGGEESRGVGTLVRFDPSGVARAQVVQPPELHHSSLGEVAALDGALWLGTEFSGEFQLYRSKGLVRFDPADSSMTIFPPAAEPFGGEIAYALLGTSDALWFATDSGIGCFHLADRRWMRWRAVPYLTLTGPTPVCSHPTLAPRGRLPAGDYEVLWVDKWRFPGWVEVVTPGVARGWMREQEFLSLAEHDFDVAPLLLTAFVNPAPTWVELYCAPWKTPGELIESGYVTRKRLHPSRLTHEPEEGDRWLEVYANAGWIHMGGPRIRMMVVPDPGESGMLQEWGASETVE